MRDNQANPIDLSVRSKSPESKSTPEEGTNSASPRSEDPQEDDDYKISFVIDETAVKTEEDKDAVNESLQHTPLDLSGFKT